MEYLAGVSFGLRLCTHLAFPYAFFFLYKFVSSVFILFYIIPPYAIVSVGVGNVASRDLLHTSNGLGISGMTGTLSIWSLANNVHLHNYLHISTVYMHTEQDILQVNSYHINHRCCTALTRVQTAFSPRFLLSGMLT